MTRPRLTPETSPPASRLSRLLVTGAVSLGSSPSSPVATSGAEDGVPSTLGLASRSSSSLSSPLPPSQISSSQTGYQRGDNSLTHQGGYRGGGPTDAGLLWPPVCCSQAYGRLQTCAGPLSPQQVFGEKEVQNGNCLICEGSHSQGRLGHLLGPERCLLPYHGSPQVQEVATLRQRQSGLPVQSPPFWPLSRTLDIHSRHERTVCQRTEEGYQTEGISRRLADPQRFAISLPETHTFTRGAVPLTGVPLTPREVFSHSFTAVQLPGNEFRHREVDCVSLARTHREVHQSSGYSSEPRVSSSAISSLTAGTDGVSVSPTPSGPPTQETSTERIQIEVEPDVRLVGQSCIFGGLVQRNAHPVDGQQVVVQRCPHLPPIPTTGAVHRRLGGGLGSSLRRTLSFGNVAPTAEIVAYQSPGDAGRSRGASGSTSSPLFEGCPSLHGQHDSCMLHQQTRGGTVGITFQESRGHSSPVSGEGDQDFGKACPRENQHPCGLPQQASHGPSDRMDDSPQCSVASVGSVGQADGGSLRDQVQQQNDNIRKSGDGSSCLEGGRPFHNLGRADSIRLSPHPDPQQSVKESKTRGSQTDPGSPPLASTTMVPGLGEHQSRAPTEASSRQKRPSSAKIRDRPRKSTGTRPSRLVTVREQLQSSGVSSGALELLAYAHRSSTQNSYESCWKRWVEWCKVNSKDPLRPSKVTLANFLAFLHTDLKLSSSSLKVHKAAVCASLRQLGRSSYSNDPLIINIIKGVTQTDSTKRRRVPAWDLFLVLNHLRDSPFEPISGINLKFLTLKTAFLISLATGRRCSEVHALSGQAFDIKHDRRNNSYTLKFLPEFIAKNQSPDQPSPSVHILPLETIVAPDDKDITLCPVRALRRYLHFTKTLRGGKRHLFISHNPAKIGDIRRPTISRWISEVVECAYKAEASSTTLTSSRAHELRALAASLHFSHSWRLQDVLDASFWKSKNSFIEFYLRDVESLRHDGSRGISSVVAAQRQVSTSRQA